MKRIFTGGLCILVFSVLAQAQAPSAETAASTPDGKLKSQDQKLDFSRAKPEDINNENFPNLIESFDYPNADIAEVVKAISKLTGKNFILDQQVRGKITIIAPSQITVAEAYKAFLSALAMNGLTVVPSGNFLKIRPARVAQRDSIETYSGRYFPNTDQLITRIIKLKYISAEEMNKQLRLLTSKDGEAFSYTPTNSLIVTDYGSNMERIMGIINQLDVPGFEERLEVVSIRFAKAKDIADLIDKIINKGQDKSKSRFRASRFNKKGAETGGKGAESFSLVIADERTNSIIVVGNESGINKIRKLVKKLDFKLRPEDAGGVNVYYVRHGDAEKIATILSGIATESTKAKETVNKGGAKSGGAVAIASAASQAVFGGDVKVTADKENNSLIISASRQDYEVVKSLLGKIDIPRDQVFVKVVIMEMSAQKGVSWGINYYKVAPDTEGIGRIGFRGNTGAGVFSPDSDSGAVIGFGQGDLVSVNIGGAAFDIPSFSGLMKFLKSNVGANILSTPQIMALDNVEAEIEVGEEVPVGTATNSTTAGSTTSIERKKATIKLTITPFISPDTDEVRMKIDQKIAQVAKRQSQAAALKDASVVINERNVKTEIVVNSGDTAVIGGLMQDQEDEEEIKVPILGDIPILGWLFKSRTTNKSKTNLLVFITPKIIRSSQDSAEILNSKLNERVDFIQKYMRGRDPFGGAMDQLPRRASGLAPPEDSQDSEAPVEYLDEPIEEPATETF